VSRGLGLEMAIVYTGSMQMTPDMATCMYFTGIDPFTTV
jgi:hypothetical protein